MKALRIFLLILIVVGLGLIATQRAWVPTVVAAIMSHDAQPVVLVPQAKPAVSNPPAHTVVPPASTSVDSGVDITATIGPTCPVQQVPSSDACADKPYQTTLVLASTQIGKNGGVLIKTDAQGHFSENLGPGTYMVRAQSTDKIPSLVPKQFTVVAHKRTPVALMFDSGIR